MNTITERILTIYEIWLEYPRWKKWLIIVALGLLLFIFLYFFRIVPLKKEVEIMKKQVEQTKLSISKLKLIEKKRDILMEKIRNLTLKIAELERVLPTGKEDVNQIIKTITRINPQVTIYTIVRNKPQSIKYYKEYPYTIELFATYPGFLKWCDDLSKSSRIINFGEIKLSKIEEDEKELAPKWATLKATLKIKAFTLNKEEKR